MRLVVTLGCIVALFTSPLAHSESLLAKPDLSDWEFIATPATDVRAVCTLSAEGVLSAKGQPIGYLATRASYADYRLHAEWRWPAKPGNGGVLVHIGSGPKDRAWPRCFQIQTKHQSAGDLLPMAGATFAEPLTSAPGAIALVARASDSEKPAGEWNTCDITCRGDTIEVAINGIAQNKVTRTSLRHGPIGFQFEGAPFELRNLTLTALP